MKILHITTASVLLLLLSSCSNWTIEEKVQEKFPHKVQTQVIWNDFSSGKFTVIWEIYSDKDSDLISKLAWDIVNINVNIWDSVNIWDILVETKSESVLIDYNNARTAYNNAVNTLNKTINSTNTSIETSRIALENSKRVSNNMELQVDLQKKQAVQSLSSAKTSVKLSIDSAKQALDNAISNAKTSEELSRNNFSNSLEDAGVAIKDSINEIDKILWIEEINKAFSSPFEDHLWAFDQNTLIDARTKYFNARSEVNSTNFSDFNSIIATLKTLKVSALSNVDLLKNSTTGINFSDNDLKSYIDYYVGLANSIQAIITSVSSQKKGLDSTIASNYSAVESAKKALASSKQDNWGVSQTVTSAENAYDVNVVSLENSLDTVNNNLLSTQSAYDWTKQLAKLQISQAKSQVDSARWNLLNQELRLNDLIIKAPFDWKITDIYIDSWDEIWAWTKIIKIKNLNSDYKIVCYLTKSQVSSVSVWDEVWVATKSLDLISSISPVADINTKKYKVEIKHSNPFLHAGQFINIHFTPNKMDSDKKGKIFLPLVSVFITSDWNYVWVSKEWVSMKKEVTLWALSGDLIEIVSWLDIWDEVIVAWNRGIKIDWEKVSVEVEVWNNN